MITNTNIPPQEFSEIEKFLLNQMSAEENRNFSERLNADKELQDKVHSVKLLITGINEASVAERTEIYHLDVIAKKNGKLSPIRKINGLKTWLIAASVIIIAGLAVFMIMNRPSGNEKLFAKYYTPDPGLITAMSETDNYDFDRAMIDYKTKHYKSALDTWSHLLALNPASDTLNYFVGSALLAQKKYDESIPYFQKVTTHQDSYFYKDACWYAGLALIRINKNDEAVPYMEKSGRSEKEAILKDLHQ